MPLRPMPPNATSPQEPDSGRGPTASRRRAYRGDDYSRVLPWALGISLVVHLLLILFVSRMLEISGRSLLGPVPVALPLPEGLEVVRVPALEPRPPLREPERPEIRPGEQEVIQVVPGEPDEGEGVEAEPQPPRMTNAERLRAQFADPRLWVPYPEEPFSTRVAEAYARADSAVRALLSTWLDSLNLTEEERRRATEWTFGEGDEKWGISDKGLHLGDITIPIPFGALFGQSMSPNAQKAREMVRQFNEIRQQDIETDIRKEREEALKEMRRRTQEEVERRRRDTADALPPDTTGG
ncbi:MAG: hypothetical protein JSV95_05700 [Gemmatimonadota bacterium]|nr:MAG: hypothetical protein JSV95_05700 [Gemmatimonadota bacterium]